MGETESRPEERQRSTERSSGHVNALTDLPESPVPASQLARICGVDVKTVHHWVEAGLIPHFRTPGRHLRFRARDVIAFLQSTGHPSVKSETRRAPLVLGARCEADVAARFVNDPYLMLVEATRSANDPLIVDSSHLVGVDPASYLDALAAAVPGAGCRHSGGA